MKTVIWFNNWFSSLAPLVINLKKSMPNTYIIGTSTNPDSAYSKVVDEFHVEKKGISSDEALEFALDFCKEHNVNIFFVRNHVSTISKNRNNFEKLGVTIICEEYQNIKFFRSKSAVYSTLRDAGYNYIPQYNIISKPEQLKELYEQFNSENKTMCIKYDSDEGAQSFRIVTDKFISSKGFYETLQNIISPHNAIKTIELMNSAGKSKDIMVMPKLDGPEVSVDCYKSPNVGFIAIPRYKIGERVKEIKFDKNIVEDCRWLYDKFKFIYGVNIQYRWDSSGVMQLLEINTRLSGGVHMSDFAGISIVKQIICDVCNIESGQSIKNLHDCRLTQYENPILLDDGI